MSASKFQTIKLLTKLLLALQVNIRSWRDPRQCYGEAIDLGKKELLQADDLCLISLSDIPVNKYIYIYIYVCVCV